MSRMPSYNTKAISLRTRPFAEADKLVTLFSRDYGKVRAIAKGARRIPSRLGGRVEPLTYGDYFIAKGRSLDIISQAQVIETFQQVREGEKTLPAALYILKLVDSGTMDGQKYPQLFDLLLDSFLELKRGGDGREVARAFVKKFVILEGIHKDNVHPAEVLSDHIGRDIRTW